MPRSISKLRLVVILGVAMAAGVYAAAPDDGLGVLPPPTATPSKAKPAPASAAEVLPSATVNGVPVAKGDSSIKAAAAEKSLPKLEPVKDPKLGPIDSRETDSSKIIERRLEPGVADPTLPADFVESGFRYPIDPPLGFTGRSSILPTVEQGSSDWVPMPDRWRAPFPSWDRYNKGHPPVNDYPNDLGNIWNPYKQNVLKGDYPIIGQHTFFNLTATELVLGDVRQTPIGTTPFESTANPRQNEFFGSPNQFVFNNFLIVSTDLNHGDSSFKPTDWRIKLTGIFNTNTLNVSELAVVNPDVRRGVQRDRTFFALEEYFVETKLADLSVYYDFMSARIGSQFFNNDFRGFLFTDTNRAVRIFGTNFANRDQFNLAFFRQAEKDTNTALNTLNDRGQNILLANYYHQDFIFNGYTIQGSAVFNNDPRSFKFDRNRFLVRPDPVGVFQQHSLNVAYLGLAGDGHIDRYNITHQLYYAIGQDTLNPLANQSQDISAFFAACELSYDRDWARFRTSFLYSSGDHNTNNSHGTGFDSIFENPNFAGGQFSYWQRQAIRLFGVNLTNAGSLLPDLRSSKIQGQSNFVNPGLHLFNLGYDADLTPKIKSINNINFLWFDTVDPLRVFTFDGHLNSFIGTDISTGLEYRPLLSNNVIVTCGFSTLVPGAGFKALYNKFKENVDPLVAGFVQMTVTY